MRFLLFTLLLLSLLFTNPNPVSAQNSESFRKEAFVSGNDTLPYRIMYPANYKPGKKYPVILFLHGSGARGNDNEKQLTAVPETLTGAEGRQKFASFIVVPQCPRNDVWVKFPNFPDNLNATKEPTKAAAMVLNMLDKISKELPVDFRRIYITGYSMGGEGTIDLLTRRPEYFAAASAICSVSDTSKAAIITKVPIWFFHGDQDKVNDVKYSRLMVDALKAHGGKPRYTEYPGVEHNSWTPAYKDAVHFTWMFGQKR